jgi:hypothetical protein
MSVRWNRLSKELPGYRTIDIAQTRGSALPPPLRSLLWLWQERRGAALLPPRDAFPVGDLRAWLGNLALIEVDAGYRFRLAGTNLITRFGREATGWSVEDLAGDIALPLHAMLRAASATGAPVAATHEVRLGRERYAHADLALPLAGGAEGVGMILFASYPLGAR